MVAYAFYDTDNRIRRYAETLARRGDRVDAIALRRKGQPRTAVINGVNVFRIQEREIDEQSPFSYLFKLILFFFRSSFYLAWLHLRRRYHLIHVHSVPDWEVLAAWVPKLLGAKVILDIHDIVPELYASKFNVSHDSWLVRTLCVVEKISGAFADHVIIANDLWRDTLLARSLPGPKCTAILNFPDEKIFYRRGAARSEGKFVMIYPGTLNHHQGLDLAIRAFSRIQAEVPQAEFHIYGTGPDSAKLRQLVVNLGLTAKVQINEPMPLEEIAAVIEQADLGVVPKRTDSFGNEAFSTKTLEFMSLGVPVLVSDSKVDRYYFNDSVVKFFRGGDEQDLAESMLLLARDSRLRAGLTQSADDFVRNYRWSVRKRTYLELVDSLTCCYRASQTVRKKESATGVEP